MQVDRTVNTYSHNYRPIPFEKWLTILVSHFYLLCDERKGRESTRVDRRKKRGREDSDPNGIGPLQILDNSGYENIWCRKDYKIVFELKKNHVLDFGYMKISHKFEIDHNGIKTSNLQQSSK